MAVLDKLWIGLRSESVEGAGTSDNMVLIVNQDGIDLAHHTLPKDRIVMVSYCIASMFLL